MSDEETQESLSMVEDLIAEVKVLKARVESLESENDILIKNQEDPAIMMRKAGWISMVTPHAAETFDPLNRDTDSAGATVGPFAGSGDMITKSRFDEIQEWEDAEREMRQ
jgi:hypothetical protein